MKILKYIKENLPEGFDVEIKIKSDSDILILTLINKQTKIYYGFCVYNFNDNDIMIEAQQVINLAKCIHDNLKDK